MKALIYKGPRELEVEDIEKPTLTSCEVLIKVAYSGICGSELSGYLGKSSLRKPPLIFGHEFSGTIVETGLETKDSKFKLGQRVTVNPLVTCGKCRFCISGKQQLCSNRKLLSASLPGSNATFVKVPYEAIHILPDHLDFEKGALVEPLACAVRVAELANVKPFDTVLITGMGPIGIFILQLMKLYGVKNIIVVDLNESRLNMAQELGGIAIHPKKDDVQTRVNQITGNRGIDVAIDAVGIAATRNQCIQMVHPGGKVVFSGLSEDLSNLQVNTIVRNEINCIGSFAYSAQNFTLSLELLATGKIGLSDEWVMKAPLSDGKYWFEKLVENKTEVSKVLLFP